MMFAALSTPADVVATATTTVPLITFDLAAKSLTVRNVEPSLLDGFRTEQRGDWFTLSPRKYGSLLHDLTQRAGLVELTTRRLSPTPGRADAEAARCEGSCPASKSLTCACPHCFGSRHGQLARLVWGPVTVDQVPAVPWLRIEHRQVAWPIRAV